MLCSPTLKHPRWQSCMDSNLDIFILVNLTKCTLTLAYNLTYSFHSCIINRRLYDTHFPNALLAGAAFPLLCSARWFLQLCVPSVILFSFHDTFHLTGAQKHLNVHMQYNGFLRKGGHHYSEFYCCTELIYSSCGEYPLSEVGFLDLVYCRRTLFRRLDTYWLPVSAGAMMHFATWVNVRLFWPTIVPSWENIDVNLASIPDTGKEARHNFFHTILHSMANIIE